jgi:DNA-directed RNA polymerase specialized sigma24 family protein
MPDDGEVCEDDLVVVEQRAEFFDERARRVAESLTQRHHDLRLQQELVREGFAGPLWNRFAEELARYGYAVVMAWLHTGEMFHQCQKKGCRLGPSPTWWTEEDRTSLANETVATAIAKFKTAGLQQHGWHVDGGATLKTYFIGACVFAFPNPYRRWKTQQHAQRELHGGHPRALDDDLDNLPPDADPADIAVATVTTWAIFNDIPNNDTKKAALLQAGGYSDPEIGELLGITPAAIAERLRRQRRRVNPDRSCGNEGSA